MKVRNQISVKFTALVAALLLLFCIVIYLMTSIQVQNRFYEELRDRAYITAYMYLEEDELPPAAFEIVRQRYARSIPGEVVQLFDMNNQAAFLPLTDKIYYKDDLINSVRNTGYVETKIQSYQTLGIFYRDNQGDFVILVSAENIQGSEQLIQLRAALITGFGLLVVIIFVSGRIFAIQALKPIPEVVKKVNQITPQKLHMRLDDHGAVDEIGELAATFNKLLDRIEENMNLQKRFVANASHELRTPLTSVIGEIEVALTRDRNLDEYKEVLLRIHEDALTLHDLINGLLEIAQTESEKLNQQLIPIRVDELVLEAVLTIEKKHPSVKVTVNYENADRTGELVVQASRPLLLNVFINVIDNAVKFNKEDTMVDIHIESMVDQHRIVISDNGPGIDEEDLAYVFNAFYRGKNSHGIKGHGIGLSITRKILDLHNGSIIIKSVKNVGTTVIIVLPGSENPPI